MGLRAFSSQLLCEQVVGRGLRRTSYETDPETGFFRPEFVNIFGVPFTFLPHEGGDEKPPPPPKPRTRIEVLSQKHGFAITWPNVVRIDQVYGHRLALDIARVDPLRLAAHETLMLAELAPTVDGKPDVTRIDQITLDELGGKSRIQTIVFRAAAEVFDQVRPGWPGNRETLLGQLVALVERFLRSDRLAIEPAIFAEDPLRRRVLLILNMSRIVQHLFGHIRSENTVARRLVLDREHPIRSTGDMLPWWTSRPCGEARRSHVNFCVYDSAWEASEAFALDRDPRVTAWVKNDHLGFEVHYMFQGGVRKFRPDFLARMADGSILVLEVKGQDTPQDRAKREFLAEWVEAVNEHAGLGRFAWDMSRTPSDIAAILAKHGGATA